MYNKLECSCDCFAKDVKIKMADGSQKVIRDIMVGDMVVTRDNGVQAVRAVMAGYEGTLISIELENGSKIRVTANHPILTTEGLVQAIRLNPGHILITESGKSDIISLYPVEYMDTVYNLILDKPSIILANGFYVGDLDTQYSM